MKANTSEVLFKSKLSFMLQEIMVIFMNALKNNDRLRKLKVSFCALFYSYLNPLL